MDAFNFHSISWKWSERQLFQNSGLALTNLRPRPPISSVRDYDSTLNRADYFNFRMMPFPKCPSFWHAKEITGKFSSFNVQSTTSWTSVLVFLEPSLPEGSRWHSPPPEQLDLYKQISSARTAISSRKGERSHVCSQISHALRAMLLWSRMNLTSS